MDSFMLPLESNEPLHPFYLQTKEEVSKECSEIAEKDIAQMRALLLSGFILLVLGSLTLAYSFSDNDSEISFFMALCFYLFALSFLLTGCSYAVNTRFWVKSKNEIVPNAPTRQKKNICFYKVIRQIFCRSGESFEFQELVSERY